MRRAFVGADVRRAFGIGMRPIVDDDRAFLLDLYASTREAELAPVPWPAEVKRAFLAQQFAAQHKYYHEVYKGADFLLILRAGASIGRVYVNRTPGEICVIEIALLSACRGQGIGTALFAELIDEARANSCEINLHVEPNNPAQRLYSRLGFRLSEHRGAYDYLVWPAGS